MAPVGRVAPTEPVDLVAPLPALEVEARRAATVAPGLLAVRVASLATQVKAERALVVKPVTVWQALLAKLVLALVPRFRLLGARAPSPSPIQVSNTWCVWPSTCQPVSSGAMTSLA